MIRTRTRSRADAAGFTLIEAVMSVLIIGVMYAAVLNTVGSARKGQATVTLQRKGFELAEHLLSEIVQQPYWDPVAQAGMGPNATEAATGNRSLFNDVDDYAGWKDKPPAYKPGNAMAGFEGWSRKVTVDWVRATEPDTSRPTESGLKRIKVSAEFGGKTVAELTALRANVD